MKTGKAKIFHLQPPVVNQSDLLTTVSDYLFDGEFETAITESKKALKIYPDESYFYIIQALSYSALKNEKEALSVISEAEKKFPTDHDVQYNLAKILEENSEYDLAEVHYNKAIGLTKSKEKESKSDYLNDLAVLYWTIGKRNEAIDKLKLASKTNPYNIKAKQNLDLFLKDIKGNLFNDDEEHFERIKVEDYFRDKNRSEFLSDSEANKVYSLIDEAWNKEITPQLKKLETLSITEKSKWFRSIKINFSNVKPGKKNIKAEHERDPEKIFDKINKQLNYLPEDSALVLPFVLPIIKSAGLSQSRFEKILALNNPSEKEIHILQWAAEIGFLMFDMATETDEDELELMMNEALDIAAEYVPRIKSREILNKIKETVTFISSIAQEDEQLPN